MNVGNIPGGDAGPHLKELEDFLEAVSSGHQLAEDVIASILAALQLNGISDATQDRIHEVIIGASCMQLMDLHAAIKESLDDRVPLPVSTAKGLWYSNEDWSRARSIAAITNGDPADYVHLAPIWHRLLAASHFSPTPHRDCSELRVLIDDCLADMLGTAPA